MPIIGTKLGILIRKKMIENISALSGKSPSDQPNPEYFNNFCIGLGNGIAKETHLIVFKTVDTGLINPLGGTGIGTGKGIKFNSDYMVKTAYEKIRSEVIRMFGHTTHAPYPPPAKNSGEYLVAILKAIADSIKEVYSTDLILNSVHYPVCTGIGFIKEGGFSGLVEINIKNSIISIIPSFKGEFWPNFAEIIASSYVDAVHNHSTAKVVIVGAGAAPGKGTGFGKVT
jgi:hypothetical protein